MSEQETYQQGSHKMLEPERELNKDYNCYTLVLNKLINISTNKNRIRIIQTQTKHVLRQSSTIRMAKESHCTLRYALNVILNQHVIPCYNGIKRHL